MKIFVDQLSGKDAISLIPRMHLAVFGPSNPIESDRSDFLVIARDDKHSIMGYCVCREWDDEAIFISYGGIMPGVRGVALKEIAQAVIKAMQDHLLEKYETITTSITSGNVQAISYAHKIGFRIIGLRSTPNGLLLELILKRGE